MKQDLLGEKYNRGRQLDGDAAAKEVDPLALQQNNRNHGRGVDGGWVFGLKQGADCRYFVVERRNAATLIPLIQRNCAPSSLIHSDEWRA